MDRKGYNFKIVLFVLSLFFFSNMKVWAQSGGQITGTVKDADTGQTLPGVNIRVKGTTTGTFTDENGKYSLTVQSLQDTLIFSSVGYQSKQMPIRGRNNIDLALKEQVLQGEGMVIVGFGTQKEENLTSSISTVDRKNIKDIPATETSQILEGQATGISVRQQFGAPGSEDAEIRIRGYGTFSNAGNNPLVIIDGIPGALSDVDPNNIASVSVLKDAAAAAIYGSRAANGVILIKTKEGTQGGLRVSYNGYLAKQNPTQLPDFVPSWTFAQAQNEANINSGGSAAYTDEDIAKFKSGEYPYEYPNADNYRDFLNTNDGMLTKHNINFTGGDSSNTYLLSLNYLRNNGLVRNNWNKEYGVQFNFNSKMSEKLDFDLRAYGNVGHQNAPGSFTGDNSFLRVINRALRMPATLYEGASPEGYYSAQGAGSAWGSLASPNFNSNLNKHFMGNLSVNYNLLENLTFTVRGAYKFNYAKSKNYTSTFKINSTLTEGPSKLSTVSSSGNTALFYGLARYEKSFKNNNVNILAGYSRIHDTNENTSGYRSDFPSNSLYELNAGSTNNWSNGGTSVETGLQSFFGRIRYDYKNKYLLEANGRYDGSSRFSKENRYGFFPSFSAAWRISNEKFIQNNFSWLNNFKIRGSWGQLGNQEIGAYPYQSTLTIGRNYVFGANEATSTGVLVGTLADQDISWETTEITDVGLDFSVLDRHLSFTADYYHKLTKGILYNLSATDILGVNSSVQNAGKVLNEGVELKLTYQNSSGDFSYSISPNISFNKNKILSLAGTDQDINQGLFVGEPLNAVYGYVDDGLFVDQNEIDNAPDQPYNPAPGEIRYKDISGPDGVPDGKVTSDYDRKIVGQTSPKYTYGAQVNAGYKNWDFALQLSGAGGMIRDLPDFAGRAFTFGSNVQQWMWDKHWTTENPDKNAKYPRFESNSTGRTSGYTFSSTYWYWDASYLRVSLIQLGYTLPSSVLNSLNVGNIRLYFAGRNIYTFDKFFPGWDPEALIQDIGSNYPLETRLTLGINVEF